MGRVVKKIGLFLQIIPPVKYHLSMPEYVLSVIQKAHLEYYEIAPIICQNIDKKQNSSEIYENIYEKWLKSAVLAVDEGKNEEAHDIYKDMVLSLKSEYYR